MSMYNDIAWGEMETKNNEYNSQTVAKYARKFPQIPRGHWSSLGPGSEEKW